MDMLQVVLTRIESGQLVIETWRREHGLIRRRR